MSVGLRQRLFGYLICGRLDALLRPPMKAPVGKDPTAPSPLFPRSPTPALAPAPAFSAPEAGHGSGAPDYWLNW